MLYYRRLPRQACLLRAANAWQSTLPLTCSAAYIHKSMLPCHPCGRNAIHLFICVCASCSRRQDTDKLRESVSTHGNCQCMHPPLATCHYHCWSLKAEVTNKLASQPPDTDHIYMLSRFRAELSVTVVQYANSYAMLHHVFQALQLSTCQYMTLLWPSCHRSWSP